MDAFETPETAGVAGSTSHIEFDSLPVQNIASILDEFFCGTQEDFFGGRASGFAGAEFAANHGVTPSGLAVATDEGGGILSVEQSHPEYMSTAEINECFQSCMSISVATPSSSEVVGVSPWDVVKDPTKALWWGSYKESQPADGANPSSESIGSASPADVDVLGSVGEDPEVEAEPPFLLEEPSRSSNDYMLQSVQNRVNEERGSGGDQVGEEADGSYTGSAEQAAASHAQVARPARSAFMDSLSLVPLGAKAQADGPHTTKRKGKAAATSSVVPCPGLVGRTTEDKKAHKADLLNTAYEKGAEVRKAGWDLISTDLISTKASIHQCKSCNKKDRRDRLLDHVVYKHLGLKTWTCPLCKRDYANRCNLEDHLNAVKVRCLCREYFTRSNWYKHSSACEEYLPHAGMLRVQNGLLEWVEQQQPAATQAEPHAPISMPEQENSGDHVRPPRAQTGRPAAIMMATKKRRASELDHEDGGEIQNGRKTKRAKRDRT